MPLNIEIFETEEAVANAASGKLLQVLINPSHSPRWGLATGGTPEKTYKALIEKSKNYHLGDLSTVNLDEYAGLSPDHPQSYAYFMRLKLFKALEEQGLQRVSEHIPDGGGPNLSQACLVYERLVDSLPPNIWLLGLGHNGHVAFNEPGSAEDSETRLIDLTLETRKANARFFKNGLEGVPTQALTVGIKTIMKSRQLLMLVTGEGKSETLQRLLRGEPSVDFPASFMKNHKDFTVLADRAAARLIM